MGSVVFLIAPGGAVLLQQRDDDVPPEGVGRWAPPGGRSEGEETPRETALREFAEETGARLERLRFFAVVSREEYPELSSDLHVFFADDVVPRERMAVNEGLDFQYWLPEQIAELRMNPVSRQIVERFLASDHYRGTVALQAPYRAGAGVVALDRWGRVLLQLRDADLPPERYPDQWSLPGGLVHPGEAPDAAAFREFEEETGVVLEELQLYRVYRRDPDLPTSLTDVFHVYFGDPDIAEEAIDVREGQAMRYFAPDELAAIAIPAHARRVLADFFASPAYRALFH